mmetsp:Transcript_20882/g.37200  ORF Transcript_20882/g.37200 Transcript_20882/m.37200 type:complete len:544 (-) Transcript_20882:291-1922(-)
MDYKHSEGEEKLPPLHDRQGGGGDPAEDRNEKSGKNRGRDDSGDSNKKKGGVLTSFSAWLYGKTHGDQQKNTKSNRKNTNNIPQESTSNSEGDEYSGSGHPKEGVEMKEKNDVESALQEDMWTYRKEKKILEAKRMKEKLEDAKRISDLKLPRMGETPCVCNCQHFCCTRLTSMTYEYWWEVWIATKLLMRAFFVVWIYSVTFTNLDLKECYTLDTTSESSGRCYYRFPEQLRATNGTGGYYLWPTQPTECIGVNDANCPCNTEYRFQIKSLTEREACIISVDNSSAVDCLSKDDFNNYCYNPYACPKSKYDDLKNKIIVFTCVFFVVIIFETAHLYLLCVHKDLHPEALQARWSEAPFIERVFFICGKNSRLINHYLIIVLILSNVLMIHQLQTFTEECGFQKTSDGSSSDYDNSLWATFYFEFATTGLFILLGTPMSYLPIRGELAQPIREKGYDVPGCLVCRDLRTRHWSQYYCGRKRDCQNCINYLNRGQNCCWKAFGFCCLKCIVCCQHTAHCLVCCFITPWGRLLEIIAYDYDALNM